MKKLFTLMLAAGLSLGIAGANADDMSKDDMGKGGAMMKKDDMGKDNMGMEGMKKPAKKTMKAKMKKDCMGKSDMKDDCMGKGDMKKDDMGMEKGEPKKY